MDYLKKENLLLVIEDIKSEENKARKRQSLKDFNCFTDNLKQYVDSAISSQFSEKTKQMMPIVSSINLVKRIVDQQSSIYMEKPERNFTELAEETKEQVLNLYKSIGFDSKSIKMEKIFNLQKQVHIYFRIVDGKIIVQPLYLHNLDVVESEENPEVAEAYIISNFDKIDEVKSDQINQRIADKDDYKRSLERYTLWSKDLNFVFDGNGKILSEDTTNEIGVIPIIDLATSKDFTYFVQHGSSLVNFAIDYNVSLSDLMFISRLQGFAQGAVSGDKETLDKMTTIEMGPAHLIKLANSPDGNPTKLEFIQRGSDINGAIDSLEILLSNFLTSMGIDPKVISGKGESVKYSSGVERLLAMVERFEAARSNYDLFQLYEAKAYEILKAFISTYSGTGLLDEEYSIVIPEDSKCLVTWKRPELVQSDADKVLNLKSRIDSGLISKVEAIQKDRGLSREEAEEVYLQIIKDQALAFADGPEDSEEEDEG